MTILSKACKPDTFESHNSLNLSFTNIRGPPSIFVDCESFLKSNSPDILGLWETNLGDLIDSGNFSVRGHLPLIGKDSSSTHAWSWSLCFFSYKGFFHGHWRLTGQQEKGGDYLSFPSTTSTRLRTVRHLFASLHVRWLSRISNRTVCIYQTATRWDLPPYRITIDWLMMWS